MDEQSNGQVTPPAAQPAATSDNKKWIIVGVVVVGLVVISNMFSPERMIERAIERETGGAVDIDINRGGGNMRIQGEDGAEIRVSEDGSMNITGADGGTVNMTSGEGAEIPDNWPDSVPVFPGAKIAFSGSSNAGAEGLGLTISFTTDESVEAVTSYYKEQLADNNWNVQTTLSTGDGSMLAATQGESGVAVYISNENPTTVNLSVQLKN